MNRKNLTAAVLAGLAGAAGIASTSIAGGHTDPVFLNADGLGEVLIYPYYTVNDGNLTVMSVVNTTDYAKAVKVRFKEGENSREVLDFNLYLSAWDVWSAAIVNDGGAPTLQIADNSCTVPYLYDREFDGPGDVVEGEDGVFRLDGEQEFLDFDYTGERADGGSSDIARAAEGYMEIIEMGELWNDGDFIGEAFGGNNSGDWEDRPYGTADAVTHVADKSGEQVPADCEQVNAQWSTINNVDGLWIEENEHIDLWDLSGGLFGSASVVNVGDGTMFSYDAKALGDFHDDGDLHEEPGTPLPSLASGTLIVSNVVVPASGGIENVTKTFNRGIDAVSSVFMHDKIINEYVVGGTGAAESTWVITFPTKAWYVDPELADESGTKTIYVNDPVAPCFVNDPEYDYNGTEIVLFGPWEVDEDGNGETGSVGSVTGVPVPAACEVETDTVDIFFPDDPFTSEFDGEACEEAGFKQWDNNESAKYKAPNTDLPIVSPPPPTSSTPGTVFELCYEVSVLNWGDSDVFGSRNAHTVNSPAGQSGWGYISFDLLKDTKADKETKKGDTFLNILPSQNDYELVGLPVVGFWAAKFVNGNVGGALANYGGLFDHKGSTRECDTRKDKVGNSDACTRPND